MQREELPLPVVPPAVAAPRFTVERIQSIFPRTPGLTSFTITRPADYRFTPGHYGRLGLDEDAAIVWRPYSIASAAADATRLAFDFTRVPGGAFTELFARAVPGDPIRLDRRSFGFLTVDSLAPGGALWLLSTGTGLAPFLSIIAEPSTWSRHERVILAHSVRHAAELMPDAIEAAVARAGAGARDRLAVLPVVTREVVSGALGVRLDALLKSGELERAGGCAIEPAGSRAMLCGNPEMIREMRALLRDRGLVAGRRGVPGQLSAEGYW